MKFELSVSTHYHCSLERAFKTPILCDVSKIHTGYGLMPRITHCTNDEHWGKPGSTKKVYAEKSWIQGGGFVSIDRILERIENEYWKFEVCDFQYWMLGFNRFVGEWRTKELHPGLISVDYSYTLYSDSILYFPFNWLFAKVFWKIYMKHVLKNIKNLIAVEEVYLFQ